MSVSPPKSDIHQDSPSKSWIVIFSSNKKARGKPGELSELSTFNKIFTHLFPSIPHLSLAFLAMAPGDQMQHVAQRGLNVQCHEAAKAGAVREVAHLPTVKIQWQSRPCLVGGIPTPKNIGSLGLSFPINELQHVSEIYWVL